MLNKKSMVDQFLLARAVGTPLISIISPDPEITITRLISGLQSNEKVTTDAIAPIIQWDCIRGWKPRNKAGTEAIKTVLKKFEVEIETTRSPIRHLIFAEELPHGSVLFILNAHHRTHQMEKPDFWQALWNLRDPFKSTFRTAVILSPAIQLPIDVSGDILTIDEGLPDEKELLQIVDSISGLTSYHYTKKNKLEAAKALQGLTPFSAEQATAFALKPTGINVNEIFDRKRELLNEIPGLKVYSGSEKFNDIGGCDEVKTLLSRVINGKHPPKVIVFIDEGEKAMAGATHAIGDNTGIAQDQMGALLTYMEDNETDGVIFVGPTGTAKTAMAKVMGNEATVPTVFLDLGAMKSSLVGASEHRLRYALKIIDSIGHGQVFFIMTSNNISKIPPEFKTRFSSGTFFFDLPTKDERQKIWEIHTSRYEISMTEVEAVEDEGWTGREIRNCCRMAYRQGITLSEASKYIVPVAMSARDSIESLRRMANGNFLSANSPGVYNYARG